MLPGVAFVLGRPRPRRGPGGPTWRTGSTPSSAGATWLTTPGLDAELIDPDQPLTEAAIAAANRSSRTDEIVSRGQETGRTFRQLAEELTGLPGGLEFTGTPEQFADLIEAWLAAERERRLHPAADDAARIAEQFTDHVVPILQARGLHRTEYTAATLRGHLRDAR